MHNMMVEKQVVDGNEEGVDFYEICDEDDEETKLDQEQEQVENHDAEVKL